MTWVKSETFLTELQFTSRAWKMSDDPKPLLGRVMNDIFRYNNTCRLW